MRLLHLSDLHASLSREDLAVDTSRNGDCYSDVLDRCPHRLDVLKGAIRDALSYGPIDAVVFTGDIADGEDQKATYESIAKLFEDLLRKSQVPVVFTPGNHDDRDALRLSWGEGYFFPGNRIRAVVPDRASSTSPMMNVLVLEGKGSIVTFDSTSAGCADGFIDNDRLNWLEDALQGLMDSDGPVAVCTHHHLREGESDMPPAPLAVDMLRLCGRFNAVVLYGHTHHVAQAVDRGVHCLTAPSLSFAADCVEEGDEARVLRFRHQVGFSIYDIESDGSVRTASYVDEDGEILADINLS